MTDIEQTAKKYDGSEQMPSTIILCHDYCTNDMSDIDQTENI